ncbi:MAG: 2Fe-2S iron-sulfur cluster-binding protein [Lautropia sp.]
MTAGPARLRLRVRAVTWEAEGILGYELVPADATHALPRFEAGAHLDLVLGNGLVRSYSLLNDPAETHRYCIAVNRDANSRGGSAWVHDALHAGRVIEADAPRNHFPLVEDAAHTVLIAGGIGITPILSMVRRLAALGRPWTLHYATRTRAACAFATELAALAESSGGALDLRFDAEPGASMLDLGAIVAALPPAAHAYCCGPASMLAAFESACEGLARERVHVEYFAAKDAPATAGGFEVKLARDGRSVAVREGQSILDALLALGIMHPNSCREGVCGTCEAKVLAGAPDHRDLVLSDAERAANDRMLICCSGSLGPSLVLDL